MGIVKGYSQRFSSFLRDPRDELPRPMLRTDVMDLKDLRPGMELTGTVRFASFAGIPPSSSPMAGGFLVRAMRFFFSSTSRTQTVTMSPTRRTSEGWRTLEKCGYTLTDVKAGNLGELRTRMEDQGMEALAEACGV